MDGTHAAVAESPDAVQGSGHPAPSRSRASLAALWFGLFGAPAAWSVQTLVNVPLASHGCFPRLSPLATPVVGVRGIAFAVSLAVLVVCVAALATSWRSWRGTSHEQQERTGAAEGKGQAQALLETGEGRTRFMAFAGVLTSATFLVVSAVHAAAVFMVWPCWG
jgi:hypothetical protein